MKKTTSLFIVIFCSLALLIVTVYDVWAIVQGGTEATISHTVFEWSYKYPIFTWSAGFFPGVLVGHLFWRLRDTESSKLISDNTRESVDSGTPQS